MIKKYLVVTATMATLSALALTACGDDSGGGGQSGDAAAVDSLNVLDYYTDDPGKTQIGDMLQKCGTSIGVAKVNHESVPGPKLFQTVLQRASSKSLPDCCCPVRSASASRDSSAPGAAIPRVRAASRR